MPCLRSAFQTCRKARWRIAQALAERQWWEAKARYAAGCSPARAYAAVAVAVLVRNWKQGAEARERLGPSCCPKTKTLAPKEVNPDGTEGEDS